MVRDFSATALELHGRASSTEAQQEWALGSVRKPVIDEARADRSYEEIRSLAISQHMLGTEEIVLIHHTGCGLLALNSDEFAGRLEAEAGVRPDWSAHAFRDPDESVREQIGRIQDSPFIPRKNVRGFVYDIETGRLREVGAPPTAGA